MDKTIVKDGWLYRNGFLRKNCKIRLTDITQMKRKKNLFGEALIVGQGPVFVKRVFR